jgi:protein gp37
MSDITDIQWCDSTVNPIMGCSGCELFPKPGDILTEIDNAVAGVDAKISSKKIYQKLIGDAFSLLQNPRESHKNTASTTNIWHFKDCFEEVLRSDFGNESAEIAKIVIRKQITCYAAVQHLNKGANILNPNRKLNSGYAETFERVTTYAGRMSDSAKLPDLLGMKNPLHSWKCDLPRMIFVSDMGDAFSAQRDFEFLKNDAIPAITSPEGKRHLWLWLTKQPERMAKFSEEIGGFSDNVCAMTTVTSRQPQILSRIDKLRKVNAHIRGLSIEPLWERIPASELDLSDIDWVIVGGESGSGALTRHFDIEWAEEIREHCKKHDVAFFLKQLGRNPKRNGEAVAGIKDSHGGEWDEWDPSLRTREFPKAFHQYRENERKVSTLPRPVKESKGARKENDSLQLVEVSKEDKDDFNRLNKTVHTGVTAFLECGKALKEIQERKLWKAGGYPTWEAYCRTVAGLSKSYAARIVKASEVALELMEKLPIGNSQQTVSHPKSESQIRPLFLLEDAEDRLRAWTLAVKKAGGQPTAKDVSGVVVEILRPDNDTEDNTDGEDEGGKETVTQRRSSLITQLKEVVGQRKSWEDVERLLSELEELV